MLIVTTILLVGFAWAVDAAAHYDPVVKCSSIKPNKNVTFQACATGIFYTPAMAIVDCEQVYVSGYQSTYNITTGLKKGTDTLTLSEAAALKAYSSRLYVQVDRDLDDLCSVTVLVKEKAALCTSCKYCGNEKYTANCTNLKNGRWLTCEKAGMNHVYYPLWVKAASATVGTPVKAPVKAPIKTPTN